MADVNSRVQKHRDSLRQAGLRPIQIWVPDSRRPGFEEECARQSRIIAQAETPQEPVLELMEEALNDTDGWTS